MEPQLVPYENQVAGWHKGEKSLLLRGKFGEILKPLKLNANPTYCEDRASTILEESGHNHQQRYEWNCGLKKSKSDSRIVNENSPEEKESHVKKTSTDTSKTRSNYTNNDEEMAAATLDELGFYTSLQSCELPLCNTLKTLIPQFMGTRSLISNGKEVIHLVLKDLTSGMQHPCVADIVMGRTSQYPGQSERSNQNKSITQEELGFCLPGMRVVHPETGDIIKQFEPDVGKQLNKQQVYDALGTLMLIDVSQHSNELTTEVLNGLREIQKWFNTQRTFILRASSILIAYDAKHVAGDFHKLPGVHTSESAPNICVNVKLIDFAHVFLSEGQPDNNYIFGLENLIEMFNTHISHK